MVRIDQVGRTAASALLLDSGEPERARARGRRRREDADAEARQARSADEEGRAAEREKARARGRRAPADSEDAEARREAGLSDSATTIDSEPEDELASADASADGAVREQSDDGVQSKPRRRGRRGRRRRSAVKAPATPE
jgi:ribonuclease G